MISIWQGTAFDISYVLEASGLLVLTIVMQKSPVFSKPIARVGLVLGVMSLVPPTLGIVGMVFALGLLVPLVI